MKCILLSAVIIMAFVNFAHADFDEFCPDKDEFKRIVKQHQSDVENKKEFEFTAKSINQKSTDTWNASAFTFPTGGKLPFDKIVALDLYYDIASGKAQFNDGGRNYLVIDLKKK